MIKAYAAFEPGGELKPFEYDPGPLGDHDVEIDVEYCGICHSDLSMLNNEWGMTRYPFVPGHEVAGRISAVGAHVKKLQVGDRVGLGWHSGYCNECQTCMEGDHNLCAGARGTIVGRHGGFADKVRAQSASVVKLPDNVSSEVAGPLFCGGITVFNPIVQFGVKPTARVGVVGIGGLGHMALQFLNAWGCEVTAFTSSEAKRTEALELGAHRTLDSRDGQALKDSAGYFDLILSTVNVKLDWGSYVNTLRPKGRLHLVGAVLEPVELNVFALMGGQRSVSSSPVGSPAVIAQMLEFAARHNIEPKVEVFDMADVNNAIDRLENGSPRYRVVLKK
ncbi:NADPH-dependent aldehyde reductase Ahr [Thalassolituus hydrocarboniclasticus]|uniref:NAD(P)-dependent alcohol dehydrogenase n=1 Tax=Thalassolituus hydrocarboniclasticus TaxID=2742796 RepID=A0ABY6A7P1_9GAMM|nr:NAD(P)-dependent alcohol dehydrogenase [Thalassolituus hydrocarboniclasticus]UXD86339.1 NAD(P)-dependent alcohol dehydrogenase [Thalassolituus hydrocarboniclasticus]